MLEAFNARDYARAAGAIAEHCGWQSVAADTVHRGPGTIVAGRREFVAAFPDWRADVERITASGEASWSNGNSSGTFQRPFRGKAPNSKRLRRRGCSVADVEGGKRFQSRALATEINGQDPPQ